MNFQNQGKIERVLVNESNRITGLLNEEPNTDNSIVIIAVDKHGAILMTSNETLFTMRSILHRAIDKATRLITKMNHR